MNKKIVITGANRGIGFAIAKELMASGVSVALCCRNPSADFAQEVASLIDDSHSIVVKLDLLETESLKHAQKQIKNWCNGVLHGLVNNAGIAYGGMMGATSISKLKEVFDINFFAQIDWTQRMQRMLAKAELSAIVNIASTAAFRGEKGTLAYGAAKLSLCHATRVMAAEFMSQDIVVNAVAPAITQTDMLNAMDSHSVAQHISQMPLKRAVLPGEVSEVVTFLITKPNLAFTGQVIRIDGGMVT